MAIERIMDLSDPKKDEREAKKEAARQLKAAQKRKTLTIKDLLARIEALEALHDIE